MRKMATIRIIDAIDPIPNADAIEVATIGGWKVVVKKGEHSVGDRVVYCEIDSWIPNHIAPFLSKGQAPREYNGVVGERLRTIKLRGQISQGLLLHVTDRMYSLPVGSDVSEMLNIQKYEPPIPAQLAGVVKGNFPSFVRKTDQERVQNLVSELAEWTENPSTQWEVTEKLDGSSMTVYFRNGEFGVCSRNLDLKEDETNSFWKVTRELGLIDHLLRLGLNYAFQGELVGEGIQKNPYGLKGQKFFLFDIYDINEGEYVTPYHRREIARRLGIPHVPVIQESVSLYGHNAENLLRSAEGKSALSEKAEREGLIFKNGKHSFKAISNKFLLKGGE